MREPECFHAKRRKECAPRLWFLRRFQAPRGGPRQHNDNAATTSKPESKEKHPNSELQSQKGCGSSRQGFRNRLSGSLKHRRFCHLGSREARIQVQSAPKKEGTPPNKLVGPSPFKNFNGGSGHEYMVGRFIPLKEKIAPAKVACDFAIEPSGQNACNKNGARSRATCQGFA